MMARSGEVRPRNTSAGLLGEHLLALAVAAHDAHGHAAEHRDKDHDGYCGNDQSSHPTHRPVPHPPPKDARSKLNWLGPFLGRDKDPNDSR